MSDSRDVAESGALLDGLGVSAAEEAAYRALLRHGPTPLTGLAPVARTSVTALRRMLPRLEEFGLVTRLPGRPLRLLATPPHVAVEGLVARRQEAIAHSRAAIGLLAAEMSTLDGPHPEELLEIVNGKAAIASRYLQLQKGVREEFLVLVRPPYANDFSRPDEQQEAVMRRGARVRGIYGPHAFDEPYAFEHTRRAITAGEEARVGNVPVKLAIADRHTALLPLTSESATAVDSALVVRPSALLDSLISLFEVLWTAATPLTLTKVDSPSGTRPSDADILTLMAAGMKDDAIARQLGVSPRTLQRRLHDLLDRLGARTRFQAGLIAARKGWLDDPDHLPHADGRTN
ncbi:helix-turn-helix transcriptional regulator [Actinomadura alba]|uniref:Transcriptional regulator n=1 Tax=Actinomadura alba TaxID=406431 RepID=A0ABR7LXC2_9ACTN|nr:LuxR family transcriptional regulator [Actinomadura alba]MBC6469508.1 transcriptional regulator [Actinomadura alba]